MKYDKFPIRLLSVFLIASLLFTNSLTVKAVEDYAAAAQERKLLPIATNEISGWPDGPAIGAQSAILMESSTGTILYAKNINECLFPASTTKILTALIAAEESTMDEMVTFSEKAVSCYDWRKDSNSGLRAGTQITMEQALYAVLVGSANDAAYAIGEHISKSMEAFAEKMNEKAKSLGCLNSNFINANGLHDEAHYTSAYDLAVIARAFFQNELLSRMASTLEYRISTTSTQKKENVVLHCKNQMFPGRTYAYEYWIGGKTGYTSISRQTLVSCAEKDGMKLICIIMKEESPNQFTDTIELFNYGFSNFKLLNVYENETKYTIDTSSLFNTENDILGSSKPILSLNTKDCIVLPITAEFEDAVSTLVYDETDSISVATILYEFSGVPIGKASVDLAIDNKAVFDFKDQAPEYASQELEAEKGTDKTQKEKPVIFLNIIRVLLSIAGVAAFIIIFFIIRAAIHNYQFARRRRMKIKKKKRKKTPYKFENLDF